MDIFDAATDEEGEVSIAWLTLNTTNVLHRGLPYLCLDSVDSLVGSNEWWQRMPNSEENFQTIRQSKVSPSLVSHASDFSQIYRIRIRPRLRAQAIPSSHSEPTALLP